MPVEVKEFQDFQNEVWAEIRQLKKQASCRVGPEGKPGKDSIVPGPRGPMGKVSKEEVAAFVKEILTEQFDEIAKSVARRVPVEVIEKAIAEAWNKRLDKALSSFPR